MVHDSCFSGVCQKKVHMKVLHGCICFPWCKVLYLYVDAAFCCISIKRSHYCPNKYQISFINYRCLNIDKWITWIDKGGTHMGFMLKLMHSKTVSVRLGKQTYYMGNVHDSQARSKNHMFIFFGAMLWQQSSAYFAGTFSFLDISPSPNWNLCCKVEDCLCSSIGELLDWSFSSLVLEGFGGPKKGLAGLMLQRLSLCSKERGE